VLAHVLVGEPDPLRRDMREPQQITDGWSACRSAESLDGLLGRKIGRPFGETLDSFLDVSEGVETGLNRL
jgi:hypothetical protein